MVSTDVPEAVRGRAVVCEALEMYPVECVARGYLTGSGPPRLPPHTARSAASALPAGLQDGSRLPEPIFTPATKAAVGDHDENVDYEAVVEAVGDDEAAELRMLTMEVYGRAHELARERGIILADTKLEFGARPDGTTVLADEVLTPDSSRFWPADQWQPGRAQPSYDKQIVRDWLTSPESGWDRASGEAPPPLPPEVVERTRLAVRRGLRAADGGDVLTGFRASVDLPVPVEVAYAYLSDPRNRPEWQSSLRSVTVPADEEPRLGQRWQETTSVGVRPQMEITEMDPPLVWAERGWWRGVVGDADPRLRPYAARLPRRHQRRRRRARRLGRAGGGGGPAGRDRRRRRRAQGRPDPGAAYGLRRRVTRVTTAE